MIKYFPKYIIALQVFFIILLAVTIFLYIENPPKEQVVDNRNNMNPVVLDSFEKRSVTSGDIIYWLPKDMQIYSQSSFSYVETEENTLYTDIYYITTNVPPYSTNSSTVYKYDGKTKEVSEIITWNDGLLSTRFDLISKSRIAFVLHGCTECGGIDKHAYPVLLLNLELNGEKATKVIERAINFRFRGPTGYEYEEALIDDDLSRECHGQCYKVGPTVYGDF